MTATAQGLTEETSSDGSLAAAAIAVVLLLGLAGFCWLRCKARAARAKDPSKHDVEKGMLTPVHQQLIVERQQLIAEEREAKQKREEELALQQAARKGVRKDWWYIYINYRYHALSVRNFVGCVLC